MIDTAVAASVMVMVAVFVSDATGRIISTRIGGFTTASFPWVVVGVVSDTGRSGCGCTQAVVADVAVVSDTGSVVIIIASVTASVSPMITSFSSSSSLSITSLRLL